MKRLFRSSNVSLNLVSGAKVRIHPSESYQGIDEGIIRIIAIYQVSEEELIPDSRVAQCFEEWVDGCDRYKGMKVEIVEYIYVEDSNKEPYYMELEDLMTHTTVY